ncbi:uncharacterized protein F5147DRAFT_277770, partial [Suillus discolor]
MGGACIALAAAGVVPALIQAAERWSSDMFQKYIDILSMGLGRSFRFCIIHCLDCISRECRLILASLVSLSSR